VPKTVIGTLCSMYVNAGNLGLPIATYVLGDAALVAPVLLLQLLLLQPVAMAVLDHSTAPEGFSPGLLVRRTLTNPLMMGALIGLALALTRVTMPALVRAPIELVGGMAVPAMLLAYGVSLRLGPRPGAGISAAEVGLIVTLKLAVQPLAAYFVGRSVLGLDDASLFAVAVLAALPTAQNIFVHAARYNRGVVVARDTIFLTTVLSVPALLVIAGLLA